MTLLGAHVRLGFVSPYRDSPAIVKASLTLFNFAQTAAKTSTHTRGEMAETAAFPWILQALSYATYLAGRKTYGRTLQANGEVETLASLYLASPEWDGAARIELSRLTGDGRTGNGGGHIRAGVVQIRLRVVPSVLKGGVEAHSEGVSDVLEWIVAAEKNATDGGGSWSDDDRGIAAVHIAVGHSPRNEGVEWTCWAA
ncbi:hypothetical protein GLOTRDRAFT_96739 [Gloeophyllum trabeum ATCC 11539]|uniref:Uncharacterized protein n=1 Tax=Gloeophyllum trabeum (strain ATCC 11539 / FP-39264 / Madison 617) TaxID=670483 RepID=S7RE95_GLOTA|nr:uncharacterized protein GLOTRDRAFT_96739 [Gloeophyllum trabeum ATCC 11539]EPQ50799.1 hypothetical protein GLOTRDRAFT_96739 [Gloeophyllum trabeum ATCC 11539]